MDEDDELRAALALSLQPVDAPAPSPTREAHGTDGNLWAPPRYVPAASNTADKTLRLVEHIRVKDGGFAWQPATAFLDTGNQHMTIVDARFAAKHAIYQADAQGPFARAERFTTLHGVVPGASSRAPVVTVALEIRGHSFVIPAAVSEMRGQEDLLLGIDVLQQLFAAGFNISLTSL